MTLVSPRRVLCLAVVCLTACGSQNPAYDGGCTTDCQLDVDGGTLPPRSFTDPVNVDNHSLSDGGRPDAGPVINAFPALTDYYRCSTDTDCPIGLGECVKTVPLNRPDGTLGTSVSITSVDSRVAAGQGVCSRVCTSDRTACDTLALRDANGDQRTFTCQVVAVGSAPYPSPAPAFPFSSQLNLSDMADGQPFAALCRPPFELHNDVADDFCAACDSTQACSGVCFDFLTGNERLADGGTGTCLTITNDGGCPVGFSARSLDGGASFCSPVQDSAQCGACVDRDDDFFGTGHCVRKSYDCDDRNGAAYFSQSSPAHPFPNYCGQFDYNCNGLSDESEQVGVATYLANHCEFCGDDKHGKTVNTGTPSQAVLACVNGTMQIQACATAGRIHCAGDVRVTGCESTGVVGGTVWYADSDGDGYGNTLQTSLGCPGGGAPNGFVATSGDCDDTNAAIHPNQPDTCDCWGTCATATARIDNDCDGQTDEDVIAYKWYSDVDNDGAPAAVANGGATFCGAPAPGLVPQLSSTVVTADCNDNDATQFNAAQRVVDATSALVSLPLSVSPPRNSTGDLYFAARGAGVEVCDGKDNDCNGVIDNGVLTTFYRDADNDGYGSASVTTQACTPPTGYVANNTDCNDNAASIHPGATEICDGIDQDCVGGADNGVALNAACTTGLSGVCSAGRTTACTNGTLTCTAWRTAETFDDPSTASDGGVDEDCDGPEQVVYVDPTGNDSNTGLVPNLPVQTIERGLQVAQANNRSQVWLVASSYTITAFISPRNRVDIVGGFNRVGTSYVWAGGATQIIQDGTLNQANRAVALYAVGLSGPTTFAHLSIQVRDPVVPGGTTVGVLANSNTGLIQLRNVQINVASGLSAGAPGANGANGDDGVPQENPNFPNQTSSTGGQKYCYGQNVNGGSGTVNTGQNGAGDVPGAGAYPGGPDPQYGFTVTATVHGGSFPASLSAFPWDIAGPLPGTIGYNGSGGGASAANFAVNSWWPGGGGGSGGCGGQGGQPGSHGGSSLGIMSYETTLVLGSTLPEDKVNITVGSGGAGSAGGQGGQGGRGGSGTRGDGLSTGRGGYGSGGRPGGGGAGGYGGWSVGIFSLSSSPSRRFCSAGLNVPARVDYSTPGTAGAAGAGGAAQTSGAAHGSNVEFYRSVGSDPGPAGLPGRIGFCVSYP